MDSPPGRKAVGAASSTYLCRRGPRDLPLPVACEVRHTSTHLLRKCSLRIACVPAREVGLAAIFPGFKAEELLRAELSTKGFFSFRPWITHVICRSYRFG